MAWAADLVLVVHSLFVAFVVLGFALIWIGHVAGWHWVRNNVFRSTHLAAITFVAIEALIGMTCPLTEIENGLRGNADERSFIARLLHAVIFYDFPEWVFTVAYVAFAVVTALTIRWVPIERK
jgi:hypothetical protein